MEKYIIGITFLLMTTGFGMQNNDRPFQRLYSLEGTWKMNGKRGPLFEEWKKVDKNYLQGRSYFLKEFDTIVAERVKLTNTRIGIYYTPVVENQNNGQSIAFKLTKVEGKSFVFENPEHDFPRRIIYHLIGSDSLHAIIDGGTETAKRQHFYLKKQ